MVRVTDEAKRRRQGLVACRAALPLRALGCAPRCRARTTLRCVERQSSTAAGMPARPVVGVRAQPRAVGRRGEARTVVSTWASRRAGGEFQARVFWRVSDGRANA